MRRILFFVVFHSSNKLENRTSYTLTSLRPYYENIIVISNSTLSIRATNQLNLMCDKIIIRKNIGYDFGAWRDGMLKYGFDKLSRYDTVTIMNDTCYFPIFDFKNHFINMENNQNLDFWGASIHKATNIGMPGTNGPVPEHIQSYFICFRKKLVNSDVFIKFWQNIEDKDDVNYVIQNYETQMTKIFNEEGFKYDAIFNPNDLTIYGENSVDPVYEVPEILLQEKFPFIKTKVVTEDRIQVFKEIMKINNSDYPIKYLKVHDIHKSKSDKYIIHKIINLIRK